MLLYTAKHKKRLRTLHFVANLTLSNSLNSTKPLTQLVTPILGDEEGCFLDFDKLPFLVRKNSSISWPIMTIL